MADVMTREQLTLLEKMKRSVTGVLNRPSQAFKDMAEAFENIINLGKKPVNQASAYQYVRQHEHLMHSTQAYVNKNSGARTEKGKARLDYAGQIMSMMGPRSLDGLRDPDAAGRLRGRTINSLTEEDFTASVRGPLENRERHPEAPSMVSYDGVQRWFTPVGSGGNKNIAAGRLGALLGIQGVTGSDQKTVVHGILGKAEGGLQSVSEGLYAHDMADGKKRISYKDENFQKDMAGLTLIRYLTGSTNQEIDSLVLKNTLAGESSKGAQEFKLTGVRETDFTSGFGNHPGMEVSEVKVLSKNMADNLRILNKDMLNHTLKDLLSEDQLNQLNNRMEQIKENLTNIKVVENGQWDEETQRLNKQNQLHSAMETLLGPEADLGRREEIAREARREINRTPKPFDERLEALAAETAAMKAAAAAVKAPAAQERTPMTEKPAVPAKTHTSAGIPPTPALPEKRTVSFQNLQIEERKGQLKATGNKPYTPPPQEEKNPMMAELKSVLKNRGETSAPIANPEKNGITTKKNAPPVAPKPLSRKKGMGL